ncbi:hypothetical protein EZS27_031922, partial [termite gut metagenome]
FEEAWSSQIEFIAKNRNITSLSIDAQVIVHKFNDVCNHYLKREIFERRGRFIGIRPYPLAMSLAQEWLEPCTPQRLLDIITEIARLSEPDRTQLSNAFAEQMKYLGYNDKAVMIVEKIIGFDSPFDNAEVLNTELGSRLFRSFVEVNPVAVSQNFQRIFSNKTTKELLEIGKGRRNIVWTLEKLCFDKRTFSDSTKIMYSFAVAENEVLSNNATGQFLQLFNLFLSGTEATLNEKWEIIKWGLSHNNSKYYELAIKAMKAGLNSRHFMRINGAEQQGTKQLQDNKPTCDEIKEYWDKILAKLTEIIKSNNNFSCMASEIVANSIRGIFDIKMVEVIFPYLIEIIQFKNNDWEEGLQGLKFARKFEKQKLSPEELCTINELINSLTKTDFISRFFDSHRFKDNDEDVHLQIQKDIDSMIELANEYIRTNVSWQDTFPILYKKSQFYSYYFGKQIYEIIKDDRVTVNLFINDSLETISSIDKKERDISILIGFIQDAEEDVKEMFYHILYESDSFNYLLFNFIAEDRNGKKYFDWLFALIDNKKCNLVDFYVFTYKNALRNLNVEEITILSEKLFSYQEEGYAITFDLFYNIIEEKDNKKKQLLISIFKKCIYKLGVNKKGIRQLDNYK